MKSKIYLSLSIVFVILTFLGAGYVLYNKGMVSPGYAIIPMLFGIIFQMLYKNSKKEEK